MNNDKVKTIEAIYNKYKYVIILRDDGYRIWAKITHIDGKSVIKEEIIWAEYKHCDNLLIASCISEYLMYDNDLITLDPD